MTDAEIITTAEAWEALPVGSVARNHSRAITVERLDDERGAAIGNASPVPWHEFWSAGSLITVIYRPDQPTEPARVLPSREQVYVVVIQVNCGDGYDAKERADETTDNLLALFADQPTVEQVKAEALREAAENVPAYVKPRLLALADRLVGCGSDAEWG